VTNGAEMRGFGEVAEWFKAAVLKTAYREQRHPAEISQTRANPSRNWRVQGPFPWNAQAQEAAHMAWRYDEAKIERRRLERERADEIEMDSMPESEGVCYFFGCEGVLVKIGYTRNLNQRINNLKGNTGPYRLRLLATARGGRTREMHYHRKFRAHSVGNEWFEFAPEIEAEIARLTAKDLAA
jgi:Meiotically up-regulated gene 113